MFKKKYFIKKNQEELYRKNLGERIKLKQYFLSSGITHCISQREIPFSGLSAKLKT